MPIEQIIAKIKEHSGIADAELNAKIDAKMEELSGLISKEGAAHIIANELSVKLFDAVTGKLQIENILEGMRDVEVDGKVLNISQISTFQRKDGAPGKVANVVLADETGSIRVVLWGDHADLTTTFKEQDILKVSSGYVRENNGKIEIHLNDKSGVVVNPEGETMGEVKATQQSKPASRKSIAALAETDDHVELMGTVVQVFEPRFFEVDPTTGRRSRPDGEGIFRDAAGGQITPDFSYVMNAVLDDGTETIRAVFFRDQAQELVGKSKEEMMQYKDAPDQFEQVKTELLGHIVKLTGKVKKNEMFERLEFVANDVDTKPDPKAELARIEAEPVVEKVAEVVVEKAEEPEMKIVNAPIGAPVEEEVVAAPAVEKPAETVSETPVAEKPAETPAVETIAEKPAEVVAEKSDEPVKTEKDGSLPSIEDI